MTSLCHWLVVGFTGVLIAVSDASPALPPDESPTFRLYQTHWKQAQEAFAARSYSQARMHYSKVAEVFPYEPTTRFQLACCATQLGDASQALNHLAEAIRFGWEDLERIEQSTDLRLLRTLPRFAELLKEARTCREETGLLHVPETIDPKKPAPLVVLLHGLGCGPRSEIPYWKAAADKLGVILVAPRGVTRAGSMLYGWHRVGAKDSKADDFFDTAAAQKRIKKAIAQVERNYTVDKRRILLAGFSQGGGVALRLQIEHPEQYCGVVAVCSLCQTPDSARWQIVLQSRPIRVALLAGQFDPLRPRSRQAAEQIRELKVPLRYEEMPGVGHEYPADYPERLRQALTFVLNPEPHRR